VESKVIFHFSLSFVIGGAAQIVKRFRENDKWKMEYDKWKMTNGK